MNRLRVAIVYHRKNSQREEDCEHDTFDTVRDIHTALMAGGYDPRVTQLPLHATLVENVVALIAHRPDALFGITAGTCATSRSREALHAAMYEMSGVPFVGSDARTLAVTQDKALTCRLLADVPGVHVPVGCFVPRGEPLPRVSELPRRCIIKPNYEGTSAGVTVKTVMPRDRVPAALKKLLRLRVYRFGARVEEYAPGYDVTVPWTEKYGALHPVVPVSGNAAVELYTYQMKSRDWASVTVAPWRGSVREIRALRAATCAIVQTLGVRDVARVDFRYDPVLRRCVFLEVNAVTNLGMTHTGTDVQSFFPVAAREDGVTYEKLIQGILATALRRFRK